MSENTDAMAETNDLNAAFLVKHTLNSKRVSFIHFHIIARILFCQPAISEIDT